MTFYLLKIMEMYLQKVIRIRSQIRIHNPLGRGTDPRIRIRPKMSRIRNTGSY